MIEVFIGTLKDNIQHEVFLWESDSLEKAFRLARKIECKIMATRKPTTHIYNDGIPLTYLKMEVLLLLDFHKLQD